MAIMPPAALVRPAPRGGEVGDLLCEHEPRAGPRRAPGPPGPPGCGRGARIPASDARTRERKGKRIYGNRVFVQKSATSVEMLKILDDFWLTC